MHILVVTPHLSTGGLPQYLLKKLETFQNTYKFTVVEWSDITGGVYVVQRNKIRSLVGENFYTLYEDKHRIFEIIEQTKPDVIHFEEIPQDFIPHDILSNLYKSDRNYKIVATTHTSALDPNNLIFLADKFILVSDWSRNVFESVIKHIPCDIWEYPIESHEFDKQEYKVKLGFDTNYKHVLNVGLFTSGKNQGELIEMARTFESKGEKVKFHFVGNQAMNFEDYWSPLMKNLPSNCIIHGEKENTSDFYKAADLFYFTSNFELNPLVVKEALSYGLPTFIKRLHTYGTTYDNLCQYIVPDQKINYDNIIETLNKN